MNLLHGRYEIVKSIGKGGTSQVFQVNDHRLQTQFAMKRIVKNTNQAEGFDHEIRIMAQLKHPNIPRIIDCFEDQEYAYVIMEYVEGMSLLQVLKDSQVVKQRILLEWMLQVAIVFEYMHTHVPEPILYLDLKPQNLLLDKKGRVYLIDFGSSSFLHHIHIHSATPGYAPKELLEAHTPCIQSDIYSFGKTFYVLYHGHFPTMRRKKDALDNILLTCCEEDIEKRYASFSQVFAAVQKERVKSSRHLRYLLLFMLLCILFFLFGILCFHELEREHEQRYQRWMKEENYKEALKWKSNHVAPYAKLYTSLCRDDDGDNCQEALLEVEEQAVLYGKEKENDIALFLAEKFMLLKTSFGYDKAQQYYGVVKGSTMEKALAKDFVKLNRWLQRKDVTNKALHTLRALLEKIETACQEISDPYKRMQYENVLLMVYDSYHDHLQDGVDRLLTLSEEMLQRIQRNPRLFSWQDRAYVEELQAMGWYYKGYTYYVQKAYKDMLYCYDLAIEKLKKTQLDNRYDLLIDMQLTCFLYGIEDEEKPKHLARLEMAYQYTSYMQDVKEQTYFRNRIHEEMTYWRN